MTKVFVYRFVIVIGTSGVVSKLQHLQNIKLLELFRNYISKIAKLN